MKHNIKLFLAAGLIGLTASCTDLDVPVESQYTTYPNTEEALEAQLAGIYFQMRDCIGRRYMEAMALSSDEFTSVAYGNNWYDNGAYAHPSLHNFTYEDASIDWMSVLGSGVVKANEVIDNSTDEAKTAMARAMRAYFTFVMMDCWGDVPIVDNSRDDIDIEERQPRADVARWIESELKAIIPLLPTEVGGDNYGKPNKYMAQTLLAKLYINWPVYMANGVENYDAATATNEKLADCVAVCDEIIKSGKFELGPDAYRFKFAPDNTERFNNGTIKDFIYVMPYHTTEATGMQYGRSHNYKDIKNLDPSYYGEKLSNSGGGYIAVTPEFASKFNLKGDERNMMILGNNNCQNDGVVYVYDKETLLPTKQVTFDKEGNALILNKDIKLVEKDFTINVGDNLEGWRQGFRSVKWFVWNSDYRNGRNQSNDVPLMRYADVLLMKAEALVRQNASGNEAQNLFNQIRSYVNAPVIDHNPSLEEIYDERGREFFDENMRRTDMIRFGHFEDEYFPHYKDFPTANFDKTRRVFPIKKEELDLNPKWKQNNGY